MERQTASSILSAPLSLFPFGNQALKGVKHVPKFQEGHLNQNFPSKIAPFDQNSAKYLSNPKCKLVFKGFEASIMDCLLCCYRLSFAPAIRFRLTPDSNA
jgi:hypothetical protein